MVPTFVEWCNPPIVHGIRTTYDMRWRRSALRSGKLVRSRTSALIVVDFAAVVLDFVVDVFFLAIAIAIAIAIDEE